MTIVAHAYPFVIGVDTHARTHTFAVLVASTGELLTRETFPASRAGMARAVAWAARRVGGDLDSLWVIEGVGSYGAQLAACAAAAGFQVVEASRMSSAAQRGVGKDDSLDAYRIAAAVLHLDVTELRTPRADDGVRAALRVLVSARQQMTGERTRTINALNAIVRVVDLGIDARRALSGRQISEISRWRARAEPVATSTARSEAVRLARRALELEADLAANQAAMRQLLSQSPAARLLDQVGIGPVTAAVAFVTWSHVGRVRSEAAFASLAGVNPIPASSGNTTRHRLNRGGDRNLNRALHMATITRMRQDPVTMAYVERRAAEGRTNKEIRRALKRYLARQIYRALNDAAPAT